MADFVRSNAASPKISLSLWERVRVRVAIVTFALTRRFAAASPGGRGKNSRCIVGPLARVMYAIRHYFNHPASR
jgi:hypothetical protein